MAQYRWWWFLLDRITVHMRDVRGKGHFTELCRSLWATWEVVLSPDNFVPIVSGTSFRDSKQQWVPTFPFAVVYWGLLYASAMLGDSRVSPWAPKMTQSPWKDCSQLDILIYLCYIFREERTTEQRYLHLHLRDHSKRDRLWKMSPMWVC